MQDHKKINWFINIGLLLIIFAVILAKPIYTMLKSQEMWSKKEIPYYRELFSADAQKKLFLFNTIESKFREPESQYKYENQYNVFVTRVEVPKRFNISQIAVVPENNLDIDRNELYYPIRSLNNDIRIKSGEISLVKKVVLKFNKTKPITIDSSANNVSYFNIGKTFMLNFNDNFNYLFAEFKNPNTSINIDLSQHGNYLYVIVMTSEGGENNLEPKRLISIINR